MILYKILHSPLGLEAFDAKSDTLPTRKDFIADTTICRAKAHQELRRHKLLPAPSWKHGLVSTFYGGKDVAWKQNSTHLAPKSISIHLHSASILRKDSAFHIHLSETFVVFHCS